MAWSNMPPEDGESPFQSYAWIIQFWRAMAERAKIFGSELWPRLNMWWWKTTVASVSEDGDNVIITVDPNGDDNLLEPDRWYNYTPPVITPESSSIPKYYDVQIRIPGPEPACWIRGQIVQTNDETDLTISSLQDYIAGNYLGSLSDLVGCKIYIIKRDGVWQGDTLSPARQRWPIHPNDHPLDLGSVSEPPEVPTTITGSGPNWSFNVDPGYFGVYLNWKIVDGSGVELFSGTVTPSSNPVTVTISNPGGTNYNGFTLKYKADPKRAIIIDIDPPNPFKDEWKINDYDGDEIVVHVGPHYQRLTLTGNTIFALIFDEQPEAPSGDWIILHPGGVGLPNRRATHPAQSYIGAMDQYYSHFPNDTISTFAMAADSVTWGEGEFSIPTSHPAFDIDLWSYEFEPGSEADKSYAPWIYHSLRMIQVEIENTCGNYVAPIDYSGKTRVNNYTPATFFHFCGINEGDSSLSPGVDWNDWLFNAGDFKGIPIMYTIIGDDDEYITSGTTTPDPETGACDIAIYNPLEVDYSGAQVIYSAGWSRTWEKRVRHFRDRWAFLPDLESDGFGGLTVKDPPGVIDKETDGNAGVGKWIKKPKSTNLETYGDMGFAADGGEPIEDLPDNAAVRYVGNNHQDPGLVINIKAEDGTTSNELLLSYWDNFYEGTHPPANQEIIRADRIGEATGGTNYYLEDTGKNWWSWWYGGGVLRTETGTAVSGSTTTLEIEPEKYDPDDEASAWFTMDHFGDGFDFPYQGFILEVDKTEMVEGSPVTVTHYLPITGYDIETGIITFDAVSGFEVETDDPYRIREPKYNLDRYAGLMLKITEPDTTEHFVEITHNDDKRLYFTADSFTVLAGWKYEITEYDRGAVMLKDGDGWKYPTGNDPRGVKWQPNPNNNRPWITHGYGRYTKADLPTVSLMTEMYTAINNLIWTKHNFGWSMEGHEDLYNTHGLPDNGTFSEPFSFIEDNLIPESNNWWTNEDFAYPYGIEEAPPWYALSPTISPASNTYVWCYANYGDANLSELEVGAYGASWNYPKITGIGCTLLACDCEFYFSAEGPAEIQGEEDQVILDGDGGSIHYRFDTGGLGYAFRSLTSVGSTGYSQDTERTIEVKVGNSDSTDPLGIYPPDKDPRSNYELPFTSPPDPAYLYPIYYQTRTGWKIDQTVAVLKWEDSLEYK